MGRCWAGIVVRGRLGVCALRGVNWPALGSRGGFADGLVASTSRWSGWRAGCGLLSWC
jgi:hypothetical protein